MNWRLQWEESAQKEGNDYQHKTATELLREVQQGRFGSYYNIWDAIAQKATLEEAGWVLFTILITDIDFLYRYHCAAALLKLMKNTEFENIQLSSENHGYKENLFKLYSKQNRC